MRSFEGLLKSTTGLNSHVSFEGELNFRVILDTTSFLDSIIEHLKFMNCSFELIMAPLIHFKRSVVFENCRFTGKLNFHGATFHSNLVFTQCVFEEYSDFTHADFLNFVFFEKNEFKNEVNFEGSIFKGLFVFRGNHGSNLNPLLAKSERTPHPEFEIDPIIL